MRSSSAATASAKTGELALMVSVVYRLARSAAMGFLFE
jgi:hypothetical protein